MLLAINNQESEAGIRGKGAVSRIPSRMFLAAEMFSQNTAFVRVR